MLRDASLNIVALLGNGGSSRNLKQPLPRLSLLGNATSLMGNFRIYGKRMLAALLIYLPSWQARRLAESEQESCWHSLGRFRLQILRGETPDTLKIQPLTSALKPAMACHMEQK